MGGGITIIPAQLSSIDKMIPILELFFKDIEKRCPEKKWNETEVRELIDFGIKSDDACVFVAIIKNLIVGVGAGIKNKGFLNPKPVFIEGILHALPSLSAVKKYKIINLLLNQLEQWAKSNDCSHIILGLDGKTTMPKFVEKKGYVESEISFKKELIKYGS